ncbi:hypothetical protein ACIPVK_02055 [Paeniglutamicibacter sp. MACA_103]|uniref:hypothetical protein n=1 Tax=Paeniglutamicibacter sp. MACA_103 TaxID=3377337 RepID=UPI003895A9E8
MSQSLSETKPKPRGIGYSMVYPPGWREFRTTAEHEGILTKLATAEAKSLGRADVVLLIRQKTHEMFEHLRRRGSLGFALPVSQVNGGAIPTSMIMTPLKVGASGTLADAVRRVAGGNPLETEAVDGANWYHWSTSERAEEAPEFLNMGLNMVIPRPLPDGSEDPDPKAGLWLLYSYAQVDAGEGKAELTEALRDLGYAIFGTFRWVPVQ